MNYEIGHETISFDLTIDLPMGKYKAKTECPRCHRLKPLGTCEDGCKMCQSCYHKVHDMGELPSDTMQIL